MSADPADLMDHRVATERDTLLAFLDASRLELDTVEGLLALYRDVCRRSREIMSTHALDEVVTHRRMGELSLRFIVTHVIREHSRHVGHVDILREQATA